MGKSLIMPQSIPPQMVTRIQDELKQLDDESVIIDGIVLKPSQCYHFDSNPAHILFNTNCPDSLKERVQAILAKYSSADEVGS